MLIFQPKDLVFKIVKALSQTQVKCKTNLTLSLLFLLSEAVMERNLEQKVMVLLEAVDFSRPEICNV